MNAILITPKNDREMKFINELLYKMNLEFTMLDVEEKEDLKLAEHMRAADRSKKVSRTTVMKKLRSTQ